MSSAITSVTFDPPGGAPGTPVTMTVTGNWEQADVVQVTTPDGASGSGTLEVMFAVAATDATGRTWTPVSNSGTQATFTGTI